MKRKNLAIKLLIAVVISAILVAPALPTALAAKSRWYWWWQPTPTPTPTPTATPTPTPTSTPAPTPTATPSPSVVNLGTIPSAWDTYETNPNSFTQLAHVDTSVLYNGGPSIRLDPYTGGSNSARECDGAWVNGAYIQVTGGDHIVFTCYVKTTASKYSQYNNDPTNSFGKGGRIGIDFYGPSDGILASALVNGEILPNGVAISGSPHAEGSGVSWNTPNWMKLTIDCVVPSGYGITKMIPWMQAQDSTDTAIAWFAGVTLYKNP